MMRLKIVLVALLLMNSVSAGAEPPRLRLGATLALSGKLALFGTAEMQGLELGVEDVNANGGIGGRKLNLVIEDNAGDPKAALNSVNKLFDVDRIDFLHSVFTHITQAVKDRVKRAGKLMIYHGGYGDIAKESKLFFRDWGDAEEESLVVIQAVAKRGFKRIAFIGETNDACIAFEKLIEAKGPELGLEAVGVESFSAGETDFKPLLLRLTQRKPDVLITCTWRDGALLMTQMKSLNLLGLPTYQTLAPLIPLNDTPEARKLYEENGAVSVWFGVVEGALSTEQLAMFSRLKKRYNSDPRIESIIAYDNVMLLAKAANGCLNAGGVDQLCVAENLRKTVYQGIAGPICFDEFGRSNRPNILMRVQDGRWKIISVVGGECHQEASTK